MFVYSAISCDEIRSLPILRACDSTCRYLLRRAATPTVKRSATSLPLSACLAEVADCASGLEQAAGEPSRPEACPKRGRFDEVGERALAVDLDHGKVLAVAGLELGVARDVDERELESD